MANLHRFARLGLFALLALPVAISAAACAEGSESDEESDEGGATTDDEVDAASGDAASGGPAPDAGSRADLSGRFLLSIEILSPESAAGTVIRFLAAIHHVPLDDAETAGTVDFELQALVSPGCDAALAGRLVGEPIQVSGIAVNEAREFTLTAGGTLIPAESASVDDDCDDDLNAKSLELAGSMEGDAEPCGTVDITASTPIAGTFGSVRLSEPVVTGDAYLPAATTLCPEPPAASDSRGRW